MHVSRPRRRAVPLILFCALLVLVAVASSGARAGERDAELPSISAEHVRRHAASGFEIARVRVELSRDGLRVRERADGHDVEVVQDFAAGRLWFVDRTRAVAHEVVFARTDGVDAVTVERVATSGGFLATAPCEGAIARELGEIVWRGRATTLFLCVDEDGESRSAELLDRALGIVVRRQTRSGTIDELQDIRPVTFAAGHFAPPSRFRRVDARELIRGAPAIGAFDERDGIAEAIP